MNYQDFVSNFNPNFFSAAQANDGPQVIEAEESAHDASKRGRTHSQIFSANVNQ